MSEHPSQVLARFAATLRFDEIPSAVVRRAADPDAVLLDFLSSTYEVAATLGRWDRAALECPPGRPGKPRAV